MKKNDQYLLKNRFFELLENHTNAIQFIKKLSNAGDLLMFGGGVRGFFEDEYQTIPRDFDIVVNTPHNDLSVFFEDIDFEKNRYGGFKIELDDIFFDVWSISSTWAFKNRKVVFNGPEDLTKTVFFNHDAIVYNINKGEIYDGGYYQSKQSKILDIILYDNPFPSLNVLRAFILMRKSGYRFSERLHGYIINWINDAYRLDDPIEMLINIQESHYGFEQLNSAEIYDAIESLQNIQRSY